MVRGYLSLSMLKRIEFNANLLQFLYLVYFYRLFGVISNVKLCEAGTASATSERLAFSHYGFSCDFVTVYYKTQRN
jgi:hypothetical protein